ncbi:3-hydroxybenzoate 6-hydroxylase 1 [Ochrobactrum quorumnocens]|uniref:3-hydroxybenzoate 6-hydroxylase 1 n=1 Tax=Ochrobactrum quorumnocens TaxID=271865 RepID=A0A248UC96_9HYPH|nr:3-hydroxybenzoate 6-monooxygenase [[Ochrobactrum] quorumnocens]ASV84443.1 3-hydroxybenzoate 6-hydroxylase 1 [[Ochrobactrum] quorumnocens]
MSKQLPIIIAGGGIGGLAAALGLARKGYRSIVLEKAPQLGEIGAGIQLGPNAFHAFDYLGVGDMARRMAVYIDSLRFMDAMTGEEVTRIPLDDTFRTRFGNPYAVVHRGELFGVFLRACKENPLIELCVGSEVKTYDQDGSSVTAFLANGETVVGRALIGADGLWSNIRRKLVGDGAPRVSGHTTYRSVIPIEEMPEDLRWNAATLWAGPKCHIVHYPLSGWKTFNLVVTYHNDAAEPVAGLPVTKEEVAKGFAHVAPVARQVIERGKDWKLWVLCDRDPVSNWVDERVALLGDAAHPMLQYFAQGACMAMEDAVCLSAELEGNEVSIESALLAYNSKRALRTARVQLQSREIGQHIYHPSGAHARLRNAMMSAKTADDWYDSVAWLYGTTGLEGAVSSELMK